MLSNGAKNATPRPPDVIASSAPCDAVARKEIRPESSAGVGFGHAPKQCRADRGDQGREEQRMRQAAVTERVAVRNSEAKSDRIEIRQRGARRAGEPETQRRPGAAKCGSDREAHGGMCER